jgi:hypothetical protein
MFFVLDFIVHYYNMFRPRSVTIFSCTHEAEWTPFQTHNFSENLVELRIEPGPLDL